MAMIIPMPSFFLEPCVPGRDGGDGNLGAGAGAGEGERGKREQLFRGGPHRREFPTKDELGNF